MVIDSSAVIAILLGEPEGPRFADLIAASPVRLMSAVSRLEAGMVIESRKGAGGRRDLDRVLGEARIQIVDFSHRDADAALEAWRRYGKGRHAAALNFGDCCTYALCKASGEPLLAKGSDFLQTDLKRIPRV